MKKLILLIIISLFVTLSYGQYASDVQQVVEYKVSKLYEVELLKKIQPKLHKAYIEEGLWSVLPVDNKKSIIRVLAMYCNIHTDQNVQFVKLYGYYSGKKIAQYTPLRGFKFY